MQSITEQKRDHELAFAATTNDAKNRADKQMREADAIEAMIEKGDIVVKPFHFTVAFEWVDGLALATVRPNEIGDPEATLFAGCGYSKEAFEAVMFRRVQANKQKRMAA